MILSRGLLDGLWMPLVNVYMNRLVDSRLRATMLSLQSVLARLGLSADAGGARRGDGGVGLAGDVGNRRRRWWR